MRLHLKRFVGFTLVEVLVAMAVLSLILVMAIQIVANTESTIGRTTRNISIETVGSAALDSIGSNLAGLITSGAATLVVVKNTAGSDSLALISNSRPASRSGTGVSVADPTDIRMSAVGFSIFNDADPNLSYTTPVPMLKQGNGTIIFSNANANNLQYNPAQALKDAVADIVGTTTKMLEFQPLATGISRLEVCYLLNDGTLISDVQPPLNKRFTVAGGINTNTAFSAPQYPLAFRSSESDDVTNPPNTPSRYVRAVLVGIVTLDTVSRRLLSGTQLGYLGSTSYFPKATGSQTPMQAWDFSQGTGTTYAQLKTMPSFVLQHLRIYQRYYYVN